MLRPSEGLLGSSKAARRANLRAERWKALGHTVRGVRALFTGLFGAVFELVLLCVLPLAYLAAAYFAVDLPARWLAHRGAWGGWGLLIFSISLVISIVGLGRAMQNSEPVAPVRPQFAKAMFRLSWIAALLLTIGDLAF
ncbi:MAG: hypothetical protein ABR567_12170 [Myxococcales bacterium]|nr:hypothetical protein [Myxococcales bacterium]